MLSKVCSEATVDKEERRWFDHLRATASRHQSTEVVVSWGRSDFKPTAAFDIKDKVAPVSSADITSLIALFAAGSNSACVCSIVTNVAYAAMAGADPATGPAIEVAIAAATGVAVLAAIDGTAAVITMVRMAGTALVAVAK